MTKLSDKEYNKLAKLVDHSSCTVGDLKTLICDMGHCPIPMKECFYYYSDDADIVCPVLVEVCKRFKDGK